MELKRWLVPASIILLLAAVCALCVYSLTSSHSTSPRFRYIPRYLSQKEIRGPYYHVHHQIFANTGDDVNRVIVNNKYKERDVIRWKLRARRALRVEN